MTATDSITPLDVLPNALTSKQYAELTQLTPSYVDLLCRNGEIVGAVKVHGSWRIPRSSVPAICVPVPPPEDAADHRRRAGQAADQLAAM